MAPHDTTDATEVLVPGKLVDALHDRDTFAEVPNVAVSVSGNRVRLTGPRVELAYLGDYVWELAGAVRDGILTTEEMGGYSVKKLYEIAARFPKTPAPTATADDVQDEPEAAPEADEVQDEAAPEPDPRAVADKLTSAQRAAMEGVDEDGRLPAATKVGTAVALMRKGLCGPQEYRRADEDDDHAERGQWLTPLGLRVLDVLRAAHEPEAAPESEAVPDEAAHVPEAIPAVAAPVPPRAASDAGSVTVAAVEAAWHVIQTRNPEIPDVVVISGGGVTTTRQKVRVTWGHFHADQWTTDGGQRHELLVSGECLGRGAAFTLTTLLHEAAHALAHVRGVKETTRAGKYHNKRFVKLAEELGLVWPEGKTPDGSFGFSHLELADGTEDAYADALAALENGRRAWRDLVALAAPTSTETAPEGTEGDEGAEAAPVKPKSKNARPKAVCGCETEKPIWLSRRVLKAGKVGCFECGQPYRAADPEDEPDDAD